MEKRYPIEEKEGTYKELGSEFIAKVLSVSSYEEYKTKEEAFRKAHPKADHYPYALQIDDYAKNSDDGEPGGTAGKPLQSLLSEKGIDHAAILVARYFGGSKLGIPRLRRAFLSAGEEAIANSRFAAVKKVLVYELSVDYPTYEKLKGLSKCGDFAFAKTDFGINVNIRLHSSDKIDGLLERKGFLLDLPTPEESFILEEIRT